jgi:asparagine synthase (glutamine-hydrolysing)
VVGDYAQAREQFPARIRGLFCGFLIDEKHQESMLFNDRFGMERLFVYEDAESFVFASEAKAILAVAEASLFRGIRVLPAGSIVRFAKRRPPRARKYFNRTAWEDVERLPRDEFLMRLGETLETSIDRHTTQPPRVAMSLTGGFDSRIIMARLKAASGAVPCYTFGSMYRETYDVRIAKSVAALCGQPHHVLSLGEEFIAGLRSYFEKAVFISDGHLGLSGAAELYLNRLARTIAPVRITGNYGGEVLRGFRAFKGSMPKGDFLWPEMAGQVRRAVRAISQMTEMSPLSFTMFCQAPSGYGRYAIERSQVMVRSPFLDDDLVQLLYRSSSQETNDIERSAWLIGRRRPDLMAMSTDRGHLGQRGQMVQRARRFYREALFKAEYWTGHGAPCWVAALTSRMPGRWIEKAFLGRHKFVHPRVWFRGDLGEYTREVLFSDKQGALACYFNLTQVRSMIQYDLQGATNHSAELDRLLTIALTSRLLLQPPATDVSDESTFFPTREHTVTL